MVRLHNLDYLRGIAAFGIMIYHFLSWSLGHFSADTFFGRLGVYGVSIFYILSGLTLHHVYFNRMTLSTSDIFLFFKKRFLRLFPLLWLVSIATLLMKWETPDYLITLLNFSGLFGFLAWDQAIATGAWSIGNEIVFYSSFPILLYAARRSRLLMLITSAIIFGIFIYFAFQILPQSLEVNQWKNYVNPLNQIFLFLSGFLLSHLFSAKEFDKKWLLLLLIGSTLLFVFYPATGEQFNLKIGANRMIFSSLALLICFCFFKLDISLPSIIHKPLSKIGEVSYGIYLIHPLVFEFVGRARTSSFHFPESVRFALSIGLTLLISNIVYNKIEKPFIRLGRRR